MRHFCVRLFGFSGLVFKAKTNFREEVIEEFDDIMLIAELPVVSEILLNIQN